MSLLAVKTGWYILDVVTCVNCGADATVYWHGLPFCNDCDSRGKSNEFIWKTMTKENGLEGEADKAALSSLQSLYDELKKPG